MSLGCTSSWFWQFALNSAVWFEVFFLFYASRQQWFVTEVYFVLLFTFAEASVFERSFFDIWYNEMVILTLSFKIKRPLRSQKQSIFTGYTRTKFLLKETFHFPVKWYSFSQKMKLAPEFDHIKNSQFFILHMCDKLLDIFSSFWFSDERTYFFSSESRFVYLPEKVWGIISFPTTGSFCSKLQGWWKISRKAVSSLNWSLLVCWQLRYWIAWNSNQRKA